MNMRLKRGSVTLVAVWIGLSSSGAGQVGRTMDVLNPNVDGEAEIAALPGVTPALASQIVEQRPFLTMAAFDELVVAVPGDAAREPLYARLFVPINLNATSAAEILLVPGVGDRMAHEFEEYRPYRALAEFRREIGKYVDDDEVARFERNMVVD